MIDLSQMRSLSQLKGDQLASLLSTFRVIRIVNLTHIALVNLRGQLDSMPTT